MNRYTWDEILAMGFNKNELAEKIGITCSFDCALPQAWLDNFVRISGLDYNKVRYSTFMTYPENGGGEIVTAWDKAGKWL